MNNGNVLHACFVDVIVVLFCTNKGHLIHSKRNNQMSISVSWELAMGRNTSVPLSAPERWPSFRWWVEEREKSYWKCLLFILMEFVLFYKNKGHLENIRLVFYLEMSLTQRFYLLVWSHNNRTLHPKPRFCSSIGLLRFCNTLNIGEEQSVLCREVSLTQVL